MYNKMQDFVLLGSLGVQPMLAKAHCIIPILWSLPPPSWWKVNVDGMVGAPRVLLVLRGFHVIVGVLLALFLLLFLVRLLLMKLNLLINRVYVKSYH